MMIYLLPVAWNGLMKCTIRCKVSWFFSPLWEPLWFTLETRSVSFFSFAYFAECRSVFCSSCLERNLPKIMSFVLSISQVENEILKKVNKLSWFVDLLTSWLFPLLSFYRLFLRILTKYRLTTFIISESLTGL